MIQSEINCPNCAEEYSEKNLPRLLINCGHTYCETCILGFTQESEDGFIASCPEDGELTKIPAKKMMCFPKNLALMKMIETKKANLSFKDESIDVSKITKNSDPQEEDDSSYIMGFIDSTQNQVQKTKSLNTSFKDSPEREGLEMCPVHQKPLDIICINDLVRICASCAIFGSHKGHDFKSLDQVQLLRLEYLNSILKIMEKKQVIQKKVTSPEVLGEMVGILASKKAKIRKNIVEAFNKMQEHLDLKKKESLKALEEIGKKTEDKMKSMIKLDEVAMQKYQDWEQRSFKQVKILEEEELEAKLLLLFQGTSIDGDIIGEGGRLLTLLEESEANNMQKIEQLLEGIGCTIDLKIIKEINNFVQIYFHKKQTKQTSHRSPLKAINPRSSVNNSPMLQVPKPQNPQKPNRSSRDLRGSDMRAKNDCLTHLEDKRVPNKINFVPNEKMHIPIHSLALSDEEDLLEVGEDQNYTAVQEKIEPRLTFVAPCPPTRQDSRISLTLGVQALATNRQQPQSKENSMLKSVEQSFIADTKTDKSIMKKKIKRIKIPEKYEKVIEGILQDSLDIVDLTNAELGDATISVIAEAMAGSKARTIKLIRNKLTDEGVAKILPHLSHLTCINLSQNMLTDNILDILAESEKSLPCLKTVILSQNKIIERKHRAKIDKVKKFGWTVSV